MTGPESDEQLAASIASRRDDSCREANNALEKLFERHAAALVAFLASRSSLALAEDVSQEIWVSKVWKQKYRGGDDRSFRNWLFTTAKNAMIDIFRRERRNKGDAALSIAASRSNTLQDLIDREDRQILNDCVDELPERLQHVFKAFINGDSHNTIAERIQIGINQSYKSLHRAKEKLTDCVQQKSK